ncbi:M13 family peptidase [Mesoplasma syrphidae]|uniref:M13 family peptidase n=1 Tax=Mesoplasma syrphidae TaxID=225999 RepID=A0A2K9BYS9_9MOLU|nr:M13 family metallopeptidase [Mesoplasma syrphidae]AUF83528.1 M13 family peptidase [Mesoplasma syrphidae]
MSKVRAQDNFFEYVNKEWMDNTKLPDGYASWGSFEELGKKADDDIKKIIHDLLSQKTLISQENQFLVNLYKNYLNDEARNKAGIAPLQPILETIDKLKSKADLTKLFIELSEKWDVSFFHSKSVDADFEDSTTRALMIDSMGLGMSDRDFYDPTHPRHDQIKAAYKVYLDSLVQESQVGLSTTNIFELVYNFEKEIAQSMLKNEELRDPKAIYNLFTAEKITSSFGFIDWTEYLTATGYIKASKIIVSEPKFFAKLTEMLAEINLEDLKDFMKIRVISGYSGLLTTNLYEIKFAYRSVFSGVTTKKPAEDRATNFVNDLIGELLSQEYVKRHFSPSAKKQVLTMVDDLIKVYKNRINDLDWMSKETKIKALEKADSFKVKIGYPDKWDDFSDLKIDLYENGGSLFENTLSIQKHYLNKELANIANPVDKDKWYMYAQTVNAYYNPTSNEICFPAAILQKPFYSEEQEHAKNLGGIGAVIGHEVSHGFDDEGSKFDKDGNLKDWWTKADYEQYKNRTDKIVEQYNAYEFNGTHVNGQLTLGENIGDLSGVAAALDICKNQAPNDLELFFENFAKVFCRISTPELRNTRLLTDPHSPEEVRVNGVFVNIDEFHELYKTKSGDKMYKPKKDRIKVW